MRSISRIALSLAAAFAVAAPASHAQTAESSCPMHDAHSHTAAQAAPAAADADVHDHSQHAMSPYAGQEGSEVRSLSAAEMKAYRGGTGMGMAKPAELNHYPGPRHVLDLRSDLALTDSQTAAIKAIFDRMHGDAVALGDRIIEKEKALDREFSSGSIDERKLRSLTGQIAELQGSLRATHLKAHLEARKILTAVQVGLYDELRGYARPAGS